MPIYNVTVKCADEERLIEAPNEATALRHAAKKYIKADAIRSVDQIRAMADLVGAKGTAVEKADGDGE